MIELIRDINIFNQTILQIIRSEDWVVNDLKLYDCATWCALNLYNIEFGSVDSPKIYINPVASIRNA